MKKTKIIIRGPDKRIYSAERQASDLPFFISHAKFIMQDEEYLRQRICRWNATCGAENEIAPSSGGIVFIDYPSFTILSAQESTMLEEFTLSEIMLFGTGQTEQLAELQSIKRIAGYINTHNATSHKKLPKQIQTWGDLDRYCRRMYKTAPSSLIRIDIQPWKINYMGLSKFGLARMKGGILNLLEGYQYTMQEEKGWAKYAVSTPVMGEVSVTDREWNLAARQPVMV
jgi:hypothetical protein